MNRLEITLRDFDSKNEGVLMPFLVIGDPSLDTSMALTETLVTAGADVLEFGFPFSDPPADGPVIQAADERALSAGVTPHDCFMFLDEVRRRFDKPVVLLIYYNLILQYGPEAFYARAAEAGVDGILVADVPLEESLSLVTLSSHHGIAPIFIVSELTTSERLEKTLALAKGFLYLVAKVGTTGERGTLDTQVASIIERIKSQTDLPVLAGFGIAQPAHVGPILRAGGDGVICGSAIIRRIAENLTEPQKMLRELHTFVTSMKDATRVIDGFKQEKERGDRPC